MADQTERKAIDWEAVEREYRAGQLSVSEIGRQHGVTEGAIRKRAKRDEWTRDLTARVREAVRAKAVRKAVRDSDARTDDEIVEEFGDRGAAVLELQRRDTSKLTELGRKIFEGLTRLIDGAPLDHDGILLGKASGAIDAFSTLANATHKLIQLERQAYNLGDGGTPDGSDSTAPTVNVYLPSNNRDQTPAG